MNRFLKALGAVVLVFLAGFAFVVSFEFLKYALGSWVVIPVFLGSIALLFYQFYSEME